MKLLNIDLKVKSANWIEDKNGMAEIEFSAEACDTAPGYQFDDSLMEEFQKTINDDSTYQYCGVSHNWFDAKVTVKYGKFEETEYLGGCSYTSYDEFVEEENGYFTDMVNTCVETINAQIQAKNDAIRNAWTIRAELKRNGNYLAVISSYKALKAIFA